MDILDVDVALQFQTVPMYSMESFTLHEGV